ncbi:hypothetical protein [Flavobacterium sp. 25HG05S-40]|uniref:hypothetical protein n=1 Tax=Flavobacterium sp. 25HG05S-40 TaxID=3458682 RepID=UPI004044F0B5
MIIVYTALVIVGFALSYLWVKFVFAVFGYIHRRMNSNPYINAEKLKIKNEKDYKKYLKWMDKKGNGVPMPMVKAREEHIAEQKITELLR